MPAVSVVIPTKNRSRLLNNAIQSILLQSFKDFEVLIIDSASTDNTKEIVSSFKDPRLNYFFLKSDKGVCAARNLGLTKAKGDFIAFLDDDDMWLPHKLQVQYDILKSQSDFDGVFESSYYVLIDESRKVALLRKPQTFQNLYYSLLAENILGNCSGLLLKRACIDELSFDENLKAAEDWDFVIRLSKQFSLAQINEPLVYYRVHRHQLSKKYSYSIDALHRIMKKNLKEVLKAPNRNEILYKWFMSLGSYYLKSGFKAKARWCYSRAINYNHGSLRGYFSFTLACLGTNAYKIAMNYAAMIDVQYL
ncbi:MAG: glycosyltransferase [Candidatus Bathyarchaeota archaeon]|nr:glycosyltransferase [Candidatus Bathyarchaeota archaeon]